MDSRGRVTVPAEYRDALGLNEGDPVVLELGDGVLHILSWAAAVERAQDLVARHIDGSRSLVDELLSERRAEATRE